MYVKIVGGAPVNYSIRQLRADNPQVSFPAEITDATLAEYSVFKVAEVAPPTVTATQRAVQGTPTLVNGSWTQTWTVQDITAELNAAKDAQAASDVDMLFGKVLFEIVNDVRVLKGQGTITRQQFINYLRSKL
jgi:hypothetical protein